MSPYSKQEDSAQEDDYATDTNVKIQKVRVMLLLAKEWLELPEAGKGTEVLLASEEAGRCKYFDSE